MTPERRKEIECRAIRTYGAQMQEDITIEEMSELTKALLKYRRYINEPGKWRNLPDAVREEIADVQIMLEQLHLIYGDSSDIEEYKLNRLWARMEAGE